MLKDMINLFWGAGEDIFGDFDASIGKQLAGFCLLIAVGMIMVPVLPVLWFKKQGSKFKKAWTGK